MDLLRFLSKVVMKRRGKKNRLEYLHTLAELRSGKFSTDKSASHYTECALLNDEL
ncbi:hypothetical protein VTH06DRAFT_7733 [Thermothelomyces fergusii]